jgi:membrane-associated phospholipid phosphatase
MSRETSANSAVARHEPPNGESNMKKLIIALTVLVGIAVGVGTASAATAITSGNSSKASAPPVGGASGAIVVAWNQQLLQIVLTPGAQPATVHPTRSFAILHAAIYDSVVSITKDSTGYLFSVGASRGARVDAAAVESGHDTLVALYPNLSSKLKISVDQLLAGELAAIPDGAAKQQGIEVGREVAAQLLADRANDGSSATPPPFVAGNQPGDFRPVPPTFTAPVFTGWANVSPFVLESANQFRPEPQAAVSSAAYANALNEVKSLGQNTSTSRTADETVAARFWAGPIWNTWNEIADNAVLAHHTNLETTARVFAVLNLTFADGVIAFYDAKYHYQIWRPVTAIRAGDTIGNPAITGDPTWTPLATTPADPSYPGAHSVISAAGASVLSSFFGQDDHIQVTSDVMKGTVRTFDSYQAVATEAGLSRIFAGVHTRLDHEAGLKLGRAVAQFVLRESRSSDFGVESKSSNRGTTTRATGRY